MVGVTVVGVSGVVVGDSAGLVGVGGADVEEDGVGSAKAGSPDVVATASAHAAASTIAAACHERGCPTRRLTGAISAASRRLQSVS